MAPQNTALLLACLCAVAMAQNITITFNNTDGNSTTVNTTTTTTTTTTTPAPVRPKIQTRGETLVLTSNINVEVQAQDIVFTNENVEDLEAPVAQISLLGLVAEMRAGFAAAQEAREAAARATEEAFKSTIFNLRNELQQLRSEYTAAMGRAAEDRARVEREGVSRITKTNSIVTQSVASLQKADLAYYNKANAAVTGVARRVQVLENWKSKATSRTCPSNYYLYGRSSDGSPRCRADRDTTKFARGRCYGDKHVTGISSSGVVTCSSYAVQRRVSRSCGGGSSIRVITQSGSVSCEKDDVGASSKRRMWSGYCSYHSRGTGWRTYCHNRQDRDSMGSGYLTRSSTGTFNIRTTGMYRLTWFFLAHGCSSKHTRVIINGNQREYRHHTGGCGNCWEVLDGSMIWWFSRGHSFYFSVHGSSCNPYRWHSGNGSGAHSRIQITHEGTL